MRGKTNIPPRKQPVINGETNNFVVAAGNTITKGDFVSYVLENDYSQFDARTMRLMYKYEYDEVNHKFVLAFSVVGASPILMLVQITQGSLVVLDSVTIESTNGFRGAYCDGTNIYTCDCVDDFSSTTASVVVAKYQISNDEIEFVQNYTQSLAVASARHMVTAIAVVGTKLYLFCRVVVSSTSYSLRAYYTELGVDFSGSNYIDKSTVGVGIFTTFLYVKGTNIVCVNGINGTSSSGTFRVYLYLYDTLTNTSSGVTSYDDTLRACDFFGERLCIVSKTKIKFFEYSNGAFTSIYDATQSSNISVAVVGRISQDEYVVLSLGGKTTLFELGDTIMTKENTLNSIVSAYSYSSYAPSVQYILSDFTTHILLECSASDGVVKYYGGLDENQGFVLGEPTNYVQEYNGGYTVGFAKTSGTGGDTIQVYTPLSS